MIALIDYGVGNLRSVQKAAEHLGAQIELTSDPEQVARAQKLILPGVGAFSACMKQLRRRNLIEPIKQAVANGVPFLGICLGMQLLFEESEEVEPGQPPEPGLGLVPGRVVRLSGNGLIIPHMGWNQIQPVRDSIILRSVAPGSFAYFVHSYVCRPANDQVTIAQSDYGENFSSIVGFEKVWGIQFHPEKSQAVGLRVLNNFLTLT